MVFQSSGLIYLQVQVQWRRQGGNFSSVPKEKSLWVYSTWLGYKPTRELFTLAIQVLCWDGPSGARTQLCLKPGNRLWVWVGPPWNFRGLLPEEEVINPGWWKTSVPYISPILSLGPVILRHIYWMHAIWLEHCNFLISGNSTKKHFVLPAIYVYHHDLRK